MNSKTRINDLDKSDRQRRLAIHRIVAYLSALCFVALSIGCNATTQRQNMLGKAAFDRGDHSQAINAFQQALNRDPNNADAYYNLSLIHI